MWRGQLWCCDVFRSFIGISGGFLLGSWNPDCTICPFRARKWPFQAPKTLRFKGKMANSEATNCKTGEKTPKGQMVPCFTRIQGGVSQESWVGGEGLGPGGCARGNFEGGGARPLYFRSGKPNQRKVSSYELFAG